MKSIYLLGALSILLSSGIASAEPTTLKKDDLFAYYDFRTSNGLTGQEGRLNPVIAPSGSQFNPVFDYNNIYSGTGGYGGGGYVGGSSTQYSPTCENLKSGNLSYATKGMAFSLKFCDIGTDGISIFSSFTGSRGDASFILSGDSLTTPGFADWILMDDRTSVISHTGANLTDLSSLGGSIPWQSLVVSIDPDGYMEIYLDGILFAEAPNGANWASTSGILQSIRFGADGTSTSNSSDGLYSDFAIWNRALTADEAAWLAVNSTAAALPVPESSTASLALLGMATLLIRRRCC